MKKVYNLIWCMVALWLSTGVFNTLVGMWEDGGWVRVGIWVIFVVYVFLFVFVLGIALKKKQNPPEVKE